MHTPELSQLSHDYRIERELGRGGMAVVYLARELMLDRLVAIKVLRGDQLEDAETVARFEREARVVAQLSHPNIVTLFGMRRLQPHGLALVMQYVAGGTLKARVREQGPLPVGEVARILREVGGALAQAHRHGVVHRDVKPENIYLEAETARALLGDFGIAQAAGAETLTMAGTALGTPAYMSPEQIDGEQLDGRSDLYSLGLMAWELLTGEQPWAGQTLTKVVYSQKHERLRPVSSYRKDVPAWFERLLERCLEKHPTERWADANALLAALDQPGTTSSGHTPVSAPAIRAEGPPRAGPRVDFIRPCPGCGGPLEVAPHDGRCPHCRTALAAVLLAALPTRRADGSLISSRARQPEPVLCPSCGYPLPPRLHQPSCPRCRAVLRGEAAKQIKIYPHIDEEGQSNRGEHTPSVFGAAGNFLMWVLILIGTLVLFAATLESW